jgi:Zn-finger protein
MQWLLLLSLLVLPAAARAEFTSLDELVRASDAETCKACHPSVYEEWASSYHALSGVNSLGVLREFIEAVERDWHREFGKEDLMRCMDCHAPQLKDASESLVREVARLVVVAIDGQDEASQEAARKSLARLNVNCVGCHNLKAAVEKNLHGAPQPGVFYGPTGKSSPAHGTARSSALTSSPFCGQCHSLYTAADREIAFCTSLYESYQDHYRANGGLESCQDCHMRSKERGHRMPGRHDLDAVRDGISLEASAVGIRLHPGRWVPAAVVSVSLGNRAGHRIPDG